MNGFGIGLDLYLFYMYNIIMIQFEWDKNKDRLNVVKHGVSFEEAATVFYDESAVVFDDPGHSIREERFLIIGMSRKMHVCIVSHCYRGEFVLFRLGRPPSTKLRHIIMAMEK